MGCQTGYSLISLSRAGGSVSGDNHVGGLVGETMGSVERSFASGDVTGVLGGVGGLVGRLDNYSCSYRYSLGQSVVDSYARGNVTGAVAGGLVGVAVGADIRRTYATGLVSAGVGGGLVARDAAGPTCPAPAVSVTASFWDTQTTGLTTSVGGGSGETARHRHGTRSGEAHCRHRRGGYAL